MKPKSMKSKKDVRTSDKFLSKKSSKTGSIGQIIIGTIVLSTIMSSIIFFPVSLYIEPTLYFNSNPYYNIDNIILKSITTIQIIGTPKLGFNTLEVSWPIWSDCSRVLKEIIQYNMVRKEIYIWIWGRSTFCPQEYAWVEYHIEIFIPFPGSWEISCNGNPIVVDFSVFS